MGLWENTKDVIKTASPLLGIGADIVGGLFGASRAEQGAQQQQQHSAQQAQKQMEFQERMSNTSWQRSVADMKKAGINPMLSIMKGGASSPAGSMSQSQNIKAAGVSAYQNQNKMLSSQIEQIHSATALTNAQAAAVRADTPKKEVQSEGWKLAQKAISIVKEKLQANSAKTSNKVVGALKALDNWIGQHNQKMKNIRTKKLTNPKNFGGK